MKTLVAADDIQRSIDNLAAEIRLREAGRPLTVIAVMTGSIIFLADLVRKLDMPLRVGVIQARSYQGTRRGSLAVNLDMLPEITDRDVLVVDDIFDTGHTLLEVVSLLNERRPRSIRTNRSNTPRRSGRSGRRKASRRARGRMPSCARSSRSRR